MHQETRKLKRMHHKLCYMSVIEKDKDGNDIKVKRRINDMSLKVFARSFLEARFKPWFDRKRAS